MYKGNLNHRNDLRRGSVCRLRRDIEGSLSGEELEMYHYLKSYQADFYIVMKRINEASLLVMPVYEAMYQESKGVSINHRRYWARFMKFHAVPEKLMEFAAGKYLDRRMETISAIYDTHNKVLEEKRRVREQRYFRDVLWPKYMKKRQKERREQERMNARMEEINVPEYLAYNAAHPFSGGCVSPR